MIPLIYADGNLWSSVGTAVQVGKNILDGVTYFVIKPAWKNGTLHASVTHQGYVATTNNNLIYPAIGVSENGNGAMAFTLTGPDYFPSAAYIPITLASGLAVPSAWPAPALRPTTVLHVSARRQWVCRPLGDYCAAVAFADDSVWIATEYISKKKRDHFTNWGTLIGVLPLPDGD